MRCIVYENRCFDTLQMYFDTCPVSKAQPEAEIWSKVVNLAAILFMQMRKTPEVKHFAYPSTAKLGVWGACMPNLVHIMAIVFV